MKLYLHFKLHINLSKISWLPKPGDHLKSIPVKQEDNKQSVLYLILRRCLAYSKEDNICNNFISAVDFFESEIVIVG